MHPGDLADRLRRREAHRQRRRLRFRRRGRRAYIRSIYLLPSLMTLGNAVCGFAAIHLLMTPAQSLAGAWMLPTPEHRLMLAAYLVLAAMMFDVLDGRLARITRHTTDFGGQLDSLADVVSFGAAPALMALHLFEQHADGAPAILWRLSWACAAIYFSAAAVRLARFNVSNEHGEQHHFSFLGLPSPGAAGVVVGWILLQQDLALDARAMSVPLWANLADWIAWLMPAALVLCGLAMVGATRYPHLLNQYLRGRRSLGVLAVCGALALLLVTAHRTAIALGATLYAMLPLLRWPLRVRHRGRARLRGGRGGI